MGYLALAIQLLESVLASAKVGNAEQQVLEGLQAAIDKMAATQGTDVTYAQLESLRTKTTW